MTPDTEMEFRFDQPPAGPSAAPAEDPQLSPPKPPGQLESDEGSEDDPERVESEGEDLESETGDEFAEDELEEAGEDEESGEPVGELLEGIREDLAAAATENRRNTRRVFDALKQFGGVLDAMATTINDIHATSRSQNVRPEARGGDSVTGLIELSDRVDRILAAFGREPEVAPGWWPPAHRAVAAWRADRARLRDSMEILARHVAGLLKSAGVERIACVGGPFDPSCMRAEEVVLDPAVADHTVLAEILPGWRDPSDGRVVRPAHVRVSRLQQNTQVSSI